MLGRRLMFLLLVCCSSLSYSEGLRAESPEFFAQPLPADAQSQAPAQVTVTRDEPAPVAPQALGREAEELQGALTRRLQMLAEELAAEGYRSEGLIDHLSALAALYRERGDDLLALGALDWALQLNRIYKGLYSLEHAALIEPMIGIVTELADYETARSLEQRLVELTVRNPDDPRVTVILAAAADRHLRDTQRILEDENAAPGFFSVAMTGLSTQFPEHPSQIRRREALMSLHAARSQYARAIAAGVNNGGYAVIDLLELEERLLSTYFLEMSHPELAPEEGINGSLCAQGEVVIENSVGNVARFRDSPTAAADLMIRLADWRLLCSRNGHALDTYESASATLRERGAPPDAVAERLSPPIPAAITASFRDLTEDGEEPATYAGYVDVSFVVGKYGSARNIEVLGASPGTTKAIERDVRGHIASDRFRPRFVEGEPTRTDRVAMRYYYR